LRFPAVLQISGHGRGPVEADRRIKLRKWVSRIPRPSFTTPPKQKKNMKTNQIKVTRSIRPPMTAEDERKNIEAFCANVKRAKAIDAATAHSFMAARRLTREALAHRAAALA
jgi:hypothetical protein